MKRIISFLFIASIVLVSCDKTSKTETSSKEATQAPESNTSTSSLVDEYNLLKSDVDQAWAYLEKIEDDKHFTMNRLLEEVSYNPRHKSSRIKEEKSKIASLQASRLKLEDLENLNNLDLYDLKSDSTVNSLYQLVEETKGMENHPLAEDLLNDLDSLNNNSTISLRSYYGEIADNYNNFIKTNKSKLEASGVKNITTVPSMFED